MMTTRAEADLGTVPLVMRECRERKPGKRTSERAVGRGGQPRQIPNEQTALASDVVARISCCNPMSARCRSEYFEKEVSKVLAGVPRERRAEPWNPTFGPRRTPVRRACQS